MIEEPASQEEQPTQIPATAIPTPEVTAVPEDTPALAPEATPEPAVPEEGAAAPEMTDTPETTAAPEATEPTEVHDPLVLSLTTDVRSAFADGNAIDMMLLIEGGAPEYTITYQVYLDGTEVANAQPLPTMENASSYSCVARAFGVHTIKATVTDAAGQTEVALSRSTTPVLWRNSAERRSRWS